MSSVEDRADLAKKKTGSTSTGQPPSRTRWRGKDNPGDAATSTAKRPEDTPRSRSTPGKQRATAPSNGPQNVPAVSSAKMPPAEQEQYLQTLLTSNRFEDAASWIVGSAYLSEKYQLADVVRLVLDQRHFDLAGRLIREHKLADNQQLVTFFVMELVRSGRFHLAVRYAQELIPHFNAPSTDPSTRPAWTPSTLIKAMIRVQQYKPALKYTLQFHLEAEFPVKKFVQGMLHEKSWLDAFTVILEHKLDSEFSLDSLIDNLLAERQWSAAIKCVKLAKRGAEYTGHVLVHHMIQSGDFVSTLHYLKEFDLTTNVEVVRHMLNFMVRYGELYKALKYSIKFGLASEPAFDSRRLIDLAIDRRQFHVAVLYIKKLKLEASYEDDLRHIAHERDHLLASFRALMAKKRQRQRSPDTQARLQACLGDLYESPEDEEEDVVVSVEEEVFPRKVAAPLEPTSLLDRLRHLSTTDQAPPPSLSKPATSRLAHLNFLDGTSQDVAPDHRRLGTSFGFGGVDRSFADVDRAFAYPPAPSPVAAPIAVPSFRNATPPQPPLPPMQPPPQYNAPQPPAPRHQFFAPPLPSQPPPPAYPPPPPSYSPPPPAPFYGYQQPPMRSSVASLAMQFHNQPPPPPPGPPLPPQATKPHRTFVPSLSLKPSPVGPKHQH